jgi:DNA invertase Pin-like site-specific DNA recombinase
VTEPDLCSDDPTRTLMRQVLGAFFEYERSMIVSKLRSARQRMKARTGRCEGRVRWLSARRATHPQDSRHDDRCNKEVLHDYTHPVAESGTTGRAEYQACTKPRRAFLSGW